MGAAQPVSTGVQPPYLFDPDDPDRGDGVRASLDLDSSLVLLAVHGSWGPGLQRDAFRAVHKCRAEHPATLILDLQRLIDTHAASASAWMSVGPRTPQALRPGGAEHHGPLPAVPAWYSR